MSLREVVPSGALLAPKGAAAPAGPRAAEKGPALPALHAVKQHEEIAPATPQPVADAPAAVARTAGPGKQKSEATPAASLLPFELLRQKFRPGVPEDLAADEPELSAADVTPPKAQRPILKAEPAATPRADAPALTTTIPKAAPAPMPSPEWRVEAAPNARPQRATRGGWLLPVGALAAAVAALVVGSTLTDRTPDVAPRADAVALGESTATPDAAAPMLPEASESEPASAEVAPPPSVVPMQAQLPAPKMSASESGVSETAAPAPADSMAEAPQTDAPPISAQPADDQAAAPLAAPPSEPAPATSPAAPTGAPIKPSVDVVRLEPNGEAVIAGRAAPGSELIILDNGEPIGTTTADAFGEWVFVPEMALPSGNHEFGLVPKTVGETVRLPAPAKPTLPPAPSAAPPTPEPASEQMMAEPSAAEPMPTAAEQPQPAQESNAGADPGSVPLPMRKPTAAEVGAVSAETQAPVAAKADFVVQLASVKTRAGAETEWRKLQQRFPELLGNLAPTVDEVKLTDTGTFFRVRTGAFASQAEAADLCARLAFESQDCLVVRTSSGN